MARGIRAAKPLVGCGQIWHVAGAADGARKDIRAIRGRAAVAAMQAI
ncbi:hypothetical protein [Komagataeibacter saccharivorans]|uniref:Uncharacterized protein n=1 Tax=Komagataeibacter saccharivorans TaxID=265959 RepID=A0A347W9X1_9PROT|nr:hypothetical protein [Komagataeibacter saccharivorans]AXY21664.1 hypothetical protein CD178_00863 [Komagataeibacter saccharivorans]